MLFLIHFNPATKVHNSYENIISWHTLQSNGLRRTDKEWSQYASVFLSLIQNGFNNKLKYAWSVKKKLFWHLLILFGSLMISSTVKNNAFLTFPKRLAASQRSSLISSLGCYDSVLFHLAILFTLLGLKTHYFELKTTIWGSVYMQCFRPWTPLSHAGMPGLHSAPDSSC